MTRRLEQSPATAGPPSCLPSRSEALAAGIRDFLLFVKLRIWNLTAKLYGFFSEMGRAVEIGKKKKKSSQMFPLGECGLHINAYVNPDLSQEEVYVRVSGNLGFLLDKPVPLREN